MQDAGSENTLTVANTDGAKGLTASPRKRTDRETVKKNLMEMGISRSNIRKILLLTGLDQKLLERRVVAGVVSGDWLNWMERMSRVQKRLTDMVCARPKLAPDGKTKIDNTEAKIAASQAIANLSTAAARIGERLIDSADPDDVSEAQIQPPQFSSTVNMQFNMPPIAKPVVDANTGTDV